MLANASRPARRLLGAVDVAEQLGISKSQAYALMDTGDLASVRLPAARGTGGPQRRKVEQSEVDAFIKRNRVTGGATIPGSAAVPRGRPGNR